MSDLDPAVKDFLSAAGKRGAASTHGGKTKQERDDHTANARRSRSKVPVLEAEVADLRTTVASIQAELAELRAERIAA